LEAKIQEKIIDEYKGKVSLQAECELFAGYTFLFLFVIRKPLITGFHKRDIYGNHLATTRD
jgi:hypothetical protein